MTLRLWVWGVADDCWGVVDVVAAPVWSVALARRASAAGVSAMVVQGWAAALCSDWSPATAPVMVSMVAALATPE